MTDEATTASDEAGGGFRLGGWLLPAGPDPAARSLVAASGTADGPHPGRAALLALEPIPAGDAAAEQAAEAVAAIRDLRHPALLPTLDGGAEAGVAGGVAFVAHPRPAGPTARERLETAGPFDPAAAGEVLHALGGALEAYHRAGLGHGALSTGAIWLDPGGGAVLGPGRLRPAPVGAVAADTAALAGVLAELLGDGRGERSPLPIEVALVVERAREPGGYPTPATLAGAFRAAVEEAAAARVAGAWESVSRRDYGMAAMLCGAALRLSPGHTGAGLLLEHVLAQAPHLALTLPVEVVAAAQPAGAGAAATVAAPVPAPPAPVAPPPARSPGAAVPAGAPDPGVPGEPRSPLGPGAWVPLGFGLMVCGAMAVLAVLVSLTFGA